MVSKEETPEDWFRETANDLKASKALYENRLYASALYYLQQANEKLAKGLLLEMGVLTHRRSTQDWKIKALLSFMPKQPEEYRHKVARSLISDMDNAAPILEQWFEILEASKVASARTSEMRKMISRSRKGVHKLKHRNFQLFDSLDDLDKEITGSKAILDSVAKTLASSGEELNRIDINALTQEILDRLRREGLGVDSSKIIGQLPRKEVLLKLLESSILGTIAVAFTSILDPLESVTRYPGPVRDKFNESNPYVVRFNDLHDLVHRLFEMAKTEV